MKAMLKIFILGACASLSVMTSSFLYAQSNSGGSGVKIAKCQDEKGIWHYGSRNLHRCADSENITTLNERGVRVDETQPIKTPEELAAETAKRDQEAAEVEKQRREKFEQDRILNVYLNEQDIEIARQKNLISIDRKIKQHTNYIAALGKQEASLKKKIANTKSVAVKQSIQAKIDEQGPKVETSEKRIKALEQEKIDANAKYDEDLRLFREYTKKN